MQLLDPGIQHYDWGSTDSIPEILGVEPDGRPWAEMWIGDHPRMPSRVVATGESLDAGLPFLLKILAAAKPLSIQTHPSLDQAIAGYAREDAAGVPLDAPHRTYRDPNHKPELICAVTPFDALCGFRHPEAIVDDYVRIEAMAPIVDRLDRDDVADALRSTVEWILSLPAEEAAELVASVAAKVPLAAELDAHFPGDPGVLVGLLLNRLSLEPGQAVFLGAGNLHAYLGGTGVEVMANSDNVVRGGLTPKHIDVPELMAVLDFSPLDPEVQVPAGAVHAFDVPVDDFALERIEDTTRRVDAADRPEIVLVTKGAAQVDADGTATTIGAGRSAFVPAGAGYELTVDGVAWRAS